MQISADEKIIRVKQLRDQDAVNEYIAKGWRLIFVGQYENQGDGVAYTVFTVGWPEENGEDIVEPESDKWRWLD